MKKLSIEEKAKRYDDAIEKAKSKIKNDKDHVLYEDDILSIFSELKESDDERIRKELIEFFTIEHWYGDAPFSAESAKERVAWLEKQGEQKPEWTPMDEQRVENLLAIIEGHGYPGEVKWLNSLKDRVQSKQGEQKFVIVPKFREGDIIKHKDTNKTFEVSKIEVIDTDEIYYHLTNGGCICEDADNFERVEHKPTDESTERGM